MKALLSKLAIITFIFLFTGNINAQDFQGKAYYFSKSTMDLGNWGARFSEAQKKQIMARLKNRLEKTYVLTFNKEESMFKQEEKLDVDAMSGATNSWGKNFSQGNQYKNVKTNEQIQKQEFYGKQFLVKDNLQPIEWDLHTETKQIGNYTCFKATASLPTAELTWYDFSWDRLSNGTQNETDESEDVEIKEDNSPLTRADTASHNVIMSYLEATGIPVLSEEGRDLSYQERKAWKQLWIVDPIDGTKEFIKRNGEFTVNIALIENQRAIIGVIFVPVTGELYFSSKEMGAFKVAVNLEDYDIEVLLSKGNKLPLQREDKTFTIVASRSHMSAETREYIQQMREIHGDVKLISKGSSLKLCMVAEGAANCYPRFAPTMEWDTAAGQAICEHAGFEVLDWETKKNMLYNREELLNNWFLVQSKMAI